MSLMLRLCARAGRRRSSPSFVGRAARRRAGRRHGQAAFPRPLPRLVGASCSPRCRPCFCSSSGASAPVSMSSAASRRSCPSRPPRAPIASRTLAAGLTKSLANGLRRLDAPTAAESAGQLCRTAAAAGRASGVALAPDTQDYMIPIAVDANRTQDTLRLVGAVVDPCARGGRRGLRPVADPPARARPQQCRDA